MLGRSDRPRCAGHGSFFYSVKTTGVYCRPGCASRQPRRENVAFHETAAAAEAAGFRPCKRCRPNEGSPADRHMAAIEQGLRADPRPRRPADLEEMAEAAGISRFHFQRVFKQITGATPREWGKAHRLGRFAERLDAGDNVAEAVYAAGYGASSRAYEAAPNGARHDARRAAPRRQRRDDELCDRADRTRSGAGRRDRTRHLHDGAQR